MDKKAKIALLTALVMIAILVVGLALAKPSPRAVKECNDRIDNDGDGDVDLADAGCDDKKDSDESNCGDDVCEGGEVCDVCIADCGHCDSCSDTDGFNHLVQGTASGYLDEIYYSDTDFCTGDILTEYYCSGNYEYSQPIDCANITTTCSNGACV